MGEIMSGIREVPDGSGYECAEHVGWDLRRIADNTDARAGYATMDANIQRVAASMLDGLPIATSCNDALARARAAHATTQPPLGSGRKLADAHSKSPDPSSQSERIAVLCPHAPTYDAGLCCGHPDDCTFVSPAALAPLGEE